MLREGVREIIAPYKNIRIGAEGECGEDMLNCDQSCNLALIVHPLSYSGGDNFYSRLQREKAGMATIVIADTNRPNELSAILKTGARGVLGKNFAKNHLLDAIRTVSAGLPYVGVEVSTLIASRLKTFHSMSIGIHLTKRETEVLKRLAVGRRTTTIGLELGISSKTVSAHKTNIMTKLDLTSYSQLVHYAIENKLFDLFVDHSNRKQRRA